MSVYYRKLKNNQIQYHILWLFVLNSSLRGWTKRERWVAMFKINLYSGKINIVAQYVSCSTYVLLRLHSVWSLNWIFTGVHSPGRTGDIWLSTVPFLITSICVWVIWEDCRLLKANVFLNTSLHSYGHPYETNKRLLLWYWI